MTSDILPAATFAYDDDKQSIVVEQRFSEAQALMRQGLTNMIEAGGKFAEIRDLLRHNKQGGFDAWIDAKGIGRRTVYRMVDLHTTFATVPNLAQLDIAASAAYLLAAPSVPEEARVEAIRTAESGERITVAKAQSIVQEYKPIGGAPAGADGMATAEQLQAAVRSWLASVWPGKLTAQRTALNQISLGNPLGTDHLNNLAAYAKSAGLRGLTGDLKRAVMTVSAELSVEDAPHDRVTYAPRVGAQADVLEAAERSLTVEEQVAAVWAFVKVTPETADRAVLDAAHRLTGSLLDLEGFSAQRGRNFDWEALIGAVGAAVDHDQLRAAVRVVRADLAARLDALPEPEPESEPIVEPAPLTAIVTEWLAFLAENNEIPTNRHGEPEKDAVRTLLTQIVKGRNNGGNVPWRKLRQHPAWPAGTTDGEKLEAVQAALAELTGVPEPATTTERPAPSWAGVQPVTHGTAPAYVHEHKPREIGDAAAARLLARKDEQLHAAVTVIYQVTAWLKSYAVTLEDVDDEVIDLIANLSGSPPRSRTETTSAEAYSAPRRSDPISQETTMDSLHPNQAPVKTLVPQLAVKFWFSGYDPERALDLFTAESVPLEAKTTDMTLREWQPARGGASLEAVRTYMQDKRLSYMSGKRISQRRNGAWQGLYLVVLGRELTR